MADIMPPGPLAYAGAVATPYIVRSGAPTTANVNFNVPTIWVDKTGGQSYILSSVALGVATWINIGSNQTSGIFTPTLIGGTVAGTTVYAEQSGSYLKSGSLVFVAITIFVVSATGTGDLVIGGLPFAVNADVYATAAIDWEGSASWSFPTSTTNLSILAAANGTTCKIRCSGTGVASSYMQMTNAALEVIFSMTYQV